LADLVFEQVLCPPDILTEFAGADPEYQFMPEAVTGDLVATPVNLTNQGRQSLGNPSQDAKRRLDAHIYGEAIPDGLHGANYYLLGLIGKSLKMMLANLRQISLKIS
jgi:hypothetical protein